MEKIAVFVNDAAHARHLLQPMLKGADPVHWIVIACPPTLTRHIGRWVSHSAREQWRERWASELCEALAPELRAAAGSKVERQPAKRPLIDVSRIRGVVGEHSDLFHGGLLVTKTALL